MLFDKIKENDRLAVFCIFLIALSVHYIFMSNNLEEWDGVQFALAIDEFDMFKHQPHPPGYPAYVLMARIVYLLVNDHIAALTVLSVVFGSLSIALTYLLAKRLCNAEIALLASILLFLHPAHFIFSLVAMNDVVALCFIVMSSCLLLKGEKHRRLFLLGALIAGLGIGVRPQNTPVIAFIYLFAFFRTEGIKIKIHSLFTSFIGVCVWFIPVVLTHGIANYAKLSSGQFTILQDSRMQFNPYGLKRNFGLLTQGWEVVFWCLLIVSIIALIIIIARQRREGGLKTVEVKKACRRHCFLPAWFLIATLTQLFFYKLYAPRYILPSLVPVVIAFGAAALYLFQHVKRRKAGVAFVLILAVCISNTGAKTLYKASILKSTAPPPVRAAAYIKENFSKDDVIIFSNTDSTRVFQYYLDGYDLKAFFDPGADDFIHESLEQRSETKWVISDIKLELRKTNHLTFERGKEIYPKHHRTNLYIYSLDRNRIKKQWKGGFYGLHGEKSGFNLRWCAKNGELILDNLSGKPLPVEMSMKLASGYEESSALRIKSKLFEETLSINKHPSSFKKNIVLRPGSNAIRFESQARKVHAPRDSRELYFNIVNFQMIELE